MSNPDIKAKPRRKLKDGYRFEAIETYEDGKMIAREWREVRDVALPDLEDELIEDPE